MRKSILRQIIKEEIRRALNEAVKVNTDEFEASHGKKPSGSGGWAFRLEDKPNGQDGEVIWPSERNYKAALKAAKREAKEEGKSYVVVMP